MGLSHCRWVKPRYKDFRRERNPRDTLTLEEKGEPHKIKPGLETACLRLVWALQRVTLTLWH